MSAIAAIRSKANAELTATVRESLAPGLPGAEEALSEIERRLEAWKPVQIVIGPVVRARGGL